MKREFRNFTLDAVEVRNSVDTDGEPMIIGHAAVFEQPANIAGLFREQVAPTAFDDALARPDDVRALFNHDPNHILGRNTAGTLRLSTDDTGLAIEIDPPDTQTGRDLLVSLERGDVNQMSFGFIANVEEWDDSDPEALPLRTLQSVQLFDVSPVTYPAYDGTDVAARSIDTALESLDAFRESQKPAPPEIDLRSKARRLALAERG